VELPLSTSGSFGRKAYSDRSDEGSPNRNRAPIQTLDGYLRFYVKADPFLIIFFFSGHPARFSGVPGLRFYGDWNATADGPDETGQFTCDRSDNHVMVFAPCDKSAIAVA
jgi:hypothetical protein